MDTVGQHVRELETGNPTLVKSHVYKYILAVSNSILSFVGNILLYCCILTCVTFTARCDPPIQPVNGYVLTNSSTFATFVCQNETESASVLNATCIKDGVWDPNPRDYCTDIESKGIQCNNA